MYDDNAVSYRSRVFVAGSECKKRWKSMRDHYKREKKEEKGTTGKVAKKKRAIYWHRLQFLDTVEDERSSFTNVLTAYNNEASTAQPFIDELHEDNLTEQTSQHSSRHELSENTQTGTSAPSPDGQTSDSAFRPTNAKTRKESVVLNKYLLERQQDREHFKGCIEDLMKYPGPQENENEIDMFFKTMAATVKKFRPDLATRTKAGVFKVFTEMELLNQQTCFPHITGLTNIQYNVNQSYSPGSASSPWTTPHSSHTEASYTACEIVSQAIGQVFQDEHSE